MCLWALACRRPVEMNFGSLSRPSSREAEQLPDFMRLVRTEQEERFHDVMLSLQKRNQMEPQKPLLQVGMT